MRIARIRASRRSWRVWGAIVVLLAASGQAHAFYWFDWPGSRVPTEQTLLNPEPRVPPGVTPPLTPGLPTQPVGPPVPVDKTPIGPPQQTPEPATALLGLLGLGTLAARRWAKKK